MTNILDELYEETPNTTMTMQEFLELPVNELYLATQLKKKKKLEQEKKDIENNLIIDNEKQ